ncbi:hypothetical protein N7448_000563 [Penicillium atrosanguineum]|uniref:Long chronological lifespan protein 2 n=1 Tax=Penicillium atrosanguineum TaxID=1132637 RepID=A0A9W9U7G3_9EURO|nr:uncharacterized protein N7443_003961 [Penicillium atrosanguineum]KAJ5134415.1 hypothetical protein N7526_005780 [Penicillium atrosanguineum]KAJ5148985.1 hypothetical protein N7448_000563 [Penicillium atrosanguineum]KAJ5304301.1 hypothetical protein N7443_003961 [Penicillium atrosanguineum]KAJ5323776.1 hypothetical protein N7476_002376 [Penicillium atrosanguineum]
MLRNFVSTLWALVLMVSVAQAQFNFFDHMFNGNQQQQQHHQGSQNVPSDSGRYQNQWRQSQCSNYLCPGTLACVSFPHHCPCAHPDVEEKVELGEGSAICVSKGGFKAGEAARKIELARKGLL